MSISSSVFFYSTYNSDIKQKSEIMSEIICTKHVVKNMSYTLCGIVL